MRTWKGVTFVILSLYFAGCATIIRGTEEDLHINSEPDKAKAVLSNGMSCITPCKFKLSRKQSFTVRFEKEGCQPATAGVYPTLAGTGVLLGGIIDYATGAVYDLQPNPVIGSLNCGVTPNLVNTIQPSDCPEGHVLLFHPVKKISECIKGCEKGHVLMMDINSDWQCQKFAE